jgi:hypothetical protein
MAGNRWLVLAVVLGAVFMQLLDTLGQGTADA